MIVSRPFSLVVGGWHISQINYSGFGLAHVFKYPVSARFCLAAHSHTCFPKSCSKWAMPWEMAARYFGRAR